MAGIFISYRRDDTAGWAGRLAKDLSQRFGPETVFQDINAIGAGEEFDTAIDKALDSCSAALVLIGPDWSTVKGKSGNRRLDDPSDLVRVEIAKALKREGVIVVPVLLGGASMPDALSLPEELQALSRRNALELSDKRWNYDLGQLAESLIKSAGLTPLSEPPGLGGTRTRIKQILAVLSTALVVFMGIVGYMLFDQSTPENAFEVFSIENPANGDVIPFGEKQTWTVEGKLRVADALREDNATPKIEVEVRKVPDGDLVTPQPGKIRLSTEQNLWRFETARFSGEGQYEIVATVSLHGRTDFRIVNVKGIPKETAFRQAIEQDRKIRGASTISTVELDPMQLAKLKNELNTLQQEFFVLLNNDLDKAEANVTQTLDLLDGVLPSHPNDLYLQNLRAYTFKNYAMVMRGRGKAKEFTRALGEAERMFETIREQKPDDAGAWNGLGSVALLQGDPERALVYIDRALELRPNYKFAKKDRETALRMLKQKERK